MSFRQKLQYLLVQQLEISNKEAKLLIESGKVFIDKVSQTKNCAYHPLSTISFDDKIIYPITPLKILKFYKPRGIECTLNPEIQDNLFELLPDESRDLFHIGRLDKESEGLLLLSNDGRIHDKLLRNTKQAVWKTYQVEVFPKPDISQIIQMQSGMKLMGRQTLPCKVELREGNLLQIELQEGMNRQIRRMCYQLDLEVVSLKRISIGQIQLGDLEKGQTNPLNDQEFSYLKSLWQ